ncbi:nadp-specific glutamate dehydrogenase [Ceraceosorus bombacis]|uniref:Glutamate dehydrogenase n=1 Tax=Ceraceosorus bombacis TaxID=401625 RepID=A0A0P1BP53_9BASI|nr:nadp-specific glutamate dehydrogenase [Ceraceosorus bombacis]
MSNLPKEPEFEQALHEVETTLAPFLKKYPEYKKALEIVQIPERIIQFRVVWEDDNHQAQVNRGFRVQFNSALGPYKGGLRLHPTVNLSVLKFLGFEQVFKNALTGIPIGGGKGGSDFDPKGKSDAEVRRFVKSFATELSRHIGADTDVPAGDIGFSTREGGFLFGQYKALKNEWVGILTGKALDWGGSHVRPEATGYGTVYYVEHMLAHAGHADGFKGKRVIISGSGQVAQFAALKVIELGGTVLTFSDSKGSLVATGEAGFTKEEIEEIYKIKFARKELSTLGDKGGKYKFHGDSARPWTLIDKYDVALPCATQNEMNAQEADFAIKAGCVAVAEGSNMGCDPGAIDAFEKSRVEKGKKGTWYGPGKAANSGGVAVSGLEMQQNKGLTQWTPEVVDAKLKDIMKSAFQQCYDAGAEFPLSGSKEEIPSLLVGANIAGFRRVANAMKDHGDWF